MTGYDLSRQWWDFAFANPEKVKPIHSALYFFAIDQCNRMGWAEKFGLPAYMAMGALGVSHHNTYSKAFDDLVEWGFFQLIQKSKNQHTANIIALSKIDTALYTALDKATLNHITEQAHEQGDSTITINKQQTTNNKPQTKKAPKIFVPPTLQEVVDFFVSEKFPKELGEHVFKYYADNDWKDSEDKGFSSWKQKMRGNWMKERNRNWNEFMAKEQVRTPKYQTYNPDIHK